MRRLPRPVYIAWRVIESLGQVSSRLCNAAIFGGSTRQSISARAHIEQWPKGRARINQFSVCSGRSITARHHGLQRSMMPAKL